MDKDTQRLVDELVRKGWRISPDHPSGTVLTKPLPRQVLDSTGGQVRFLPAGLGRIGFDSRAS